MVGGRRPAVVAVHRRLEQSVERQRSLAPVGHVVVVHRVFDVDEREQRGSLAAAVVAHAQQEGDGVVDAPQPVRHRRVLLLVVQVEHDDAEEDRQRRHAHDQGQVDAWKNKGACSPGDKAMAVDGICEKM